MRRQLFAWYLRVVMAAVLLVEGGQAHDVFDVVELTDTVARVRTAFLFDLGEDMTVRIERNGQTVDIPARVRAHVGTGPDKITELELGDQAA